MRLWEIMQLSICILTYNQPDLLPRCVASCLTEIEREGITSEIMVIDNASTDHNPQQVAKLSPLISVVRNQENLGFSKANNIGIRMSRGRYVLILNDDTEFCSGALGLLVRALDADPRVGAVGPKLLNPDGSLQSGSTHMRFPHLRGTVLALLRLDSVLEKLPATRDLLTHSCDENTDSDAEHLTAACLLARREALDAVGLFDEGFYFYFEDVDLCYRLKKAGWQLVYFPDAQVTHYGSASFKKLLRSRQNAMCLAGLIRYFRKHSSPGRFLLFRLTLALTLCLRMPVAILLSLSPVSRVRSQWKGIVQAHVKVLRSLLFA
jgi:hypothetical protein